MISLDLSELPEIIFSREPSDSICVTELTVVLLIISVDCTEPPEAVSATGPPDIIFVVVTVLDSFIDSLVGFVVVMIVSVLSVDGIESPPDFSVTKLSPEITSLIESPEVFPLTELPDSISLVIMVFDSCFDSLIGMVDLMIVSLVVVVTEPPEVIPVDGTDAPNTVPVALEVIWVTEPKEVISAVEPSDVISATGSPDVICLVAVVLDSCFVSLIGIADLVIVSLTVVVAESATPDIFSVAVPPEVSLVVMVSNSCLESLTGIVVLVTASLVEVVTDLLDVISVARPVEVTPFSEPLDVISLLVTVFDSCFASLTAIADLVIVSSVVVVTETPEVLPVSDSPGIISLVEPVVVFLVVMISNSCFESLTGTVLATTVPLTIFATEPVDVISVTGLPATISLVFNSCFGSLIGIAVPVTVSSVNVVVVDADVDKPSVTSLSYTRNIKVIFLLQKQLLR